MVNFAALAFLATAVSAVALPHDDWKNNYKCPAPKTEYITKVVPTTVIKKEVETKTVTDYKYKTQTETITITPHPVTKHETITKEIYVTKYEKCKDWKDNKHGGHP